MAIRFTSLTSGDGGTGVSSVATASISPNPNKLILVAVATKINLSDPNTPTITGASMTWTQITTILKSTPQKQRITLFRAMSATPGSGALTIDWSGQNQERLAWVIVEVAGVMTTGSNGSGAIVQSTTGEAASSSTSFQLVLSSLTNNRNATYGAFQNINQSITPGTNYTEIAEVDTAETNLQHEYRSPGNPVVDWSFSAIDGGLGIAVELAASSVGGGAFLFNMI